MLERKVAELCARAEVPIPLPVIRPHQNYERNYCLGPDSHSLPRSWCHHHEGVVGHVLVGWLDLLPRALFLQSGRILL